MDDNNFDNWQSVDGYEAKNFKISQRDYYLLAGFVASCAAIVFLSWCLN